MHTLSYNRSVLIRANIFKVIDFIKEVENLPKWTKFYKKINLKVNNKFMVETLIGPAITMIIEKINNEEFIYEICSEFLAFNGEPQKKEVAEIKVKNFYQNVVLSFSINLPNSWEKSRVDSQLSQLDQELNNLKIIMES